MKIFLSTAVVLAMLTGCATPTPEELSRADYGSYPTNYESIVKSYLRSSLKDPDSAQVSFLNPPKSGWNGIGGVKYGYIVCVQINGKNSFGAYVGYRPAYFMIKNDVVIDATLGDGSYGDSIAQGKCKKFV